MVVDRGCPVDVHQSFLGHDYTFLWDLGFRVHRKLGAVDPYVCSTEAGNQRTLKACRKQTRYENMALSEE
jgi:hypothetical protein